MFCLGQRLVLHYGESAGRTGCASSAAGRSLGEADVHVTALASLGLGAVGRCAALVAFQT